MKAGVSYRVAFALVLSIASGRSEGAGALSLECQIDSTNVLERIPILVRLAVLNVGDSGAITIFPRNEPEVLAGRAALVLRDSHGRSHTLNFRGGPSACGPAPIAIHRIEPGAQRVAERVFLPVSMTPPPPRWAGKISELYQFLAPGTYTGWVEVALLQGRKLQCESFQISIVGASDQDARARDRIRFEHLPFLEGRDAAPDMSYYHGGKWWRKVDVSRFQEIQGILEDFPDSEYAKWIRFWKVYHHGSEDEALDYVRTHDSFPLSDNLMFRVARRVSDDDRRQREAVELLAELERIFPNGDTVHRAKAMREKLLSKKRRR